MANKEKAGREKQNVETAYPLSQHLTELRKRLVYSFLGLLIVFIAVYSQRVYVSKILEKPIVGLLPPGSSLSMLSIIEGFMTELKLCIVVAIIVSTPFLLYHLWKFIAPGLYAQERKYIFGFVFFASLLFFGGASFAYFLVLPLGFKFFLSYAAEGTALTANLSIAWYFNFILRLLLAFGVVFELPVIIFFLAKIGIVTDVMLKKYRGFAIVGIFILAAVLTPPDVISQTTMAIPLLILYELSIWIAKVFGRKQKTTAEVAIYE